MDGNGRNDEEEEEEEKKIQTLNHCKNENSLSVSCYSFIFSFHSFVVVVDDDSNIIIVGLALRLMLDVGWLAGWLNRWDWDEWIWKLRCYFRLLGEFSTIDGKIFNFFFKNGNCGNTSVKKHFVVSNEWEGNQFQWYTRTKKKIK